MRREQLQRSLRATLPSTARRMLGVTIAIAALCTPSALAGSSSGITDQKVIIPAAVATADAIAAVGQSRVNQDQSWQDYEYVAIVAVMNEAEKLSLNSGAPLTSAQLTRFGTAAKSWLDSQRPETAVFLAKDRAARLRLVIDTMCFHAAELKSSSPLFLDALEFVERAKSRELEVTTPITGLPPNPYYYSGSSAKIANANAFIGRTLKEAVSLANDSPIYAALANPYLMDLTGLNASSTYAQAIQLYPHILPSLSAPNTDGSYNLDLFALLNIYNDQVTIAQGIATCVLDTIEKKECTNPQYVPRAASVVSHADRLLLSVV